MKSHDVIIVGGGIIGLTLAFELRKHGSSVLVIERGEPGRESSRAAAGMLAFGDPDTNPALRDLCFASARLFPEMLREIEDASGDNVDFRREGTIAIGTFQSEEDPICEWKDLWDYELKQLEPHIAYQHGLRYALLQEQSVDNRALTAATAKACRHRNVEIASGSEVISIEIAGRRAAGVQTSRAHYAANVVVNCAGAWAGGFSPISLPTRPRKGQMLSVVPEHDKVLGHVVRASIPPVYLVPRTDGRIVIGATVEDVGYDKRVEPDVIQLLHQSAANLIPAIGEMRIHEAWAGLRPGTPDDLPILGRTNIDGYFVATGHYRNGILLSAVTAKLMTNLIRGLDPGFDLTRFSADRFTASDAS